MPIGCGNRAKIDGIHASENAVTARWSIGRRTSSSKRMYPPTAATGALVNGWPPIAHRCSYRSRIGDTAPLGVCINGSRSA